MTSHSAQQAGAAAGMLRPFGALAVVGAGMSAGGYPMTAQLPPLMWQAIDTSPAALEHLRSLTARTGTAKQLLGTEIGPGWPLLRTHDTARRAFQEAFAAVDRDRKPSSAHFDLARLVEAGVVEAVVSYNWDTCLERAYGELFGVPLPEGLLHKPHGDVAQSATDWTFPDEDGLVPATVRDLVLRLSDRPRTLLMIGYSGSDAAVVEALLEPLEQRWPVVRIGPSATGEGAIASGADRALAALAAHLIPDVPHRGWKYIGFTHSRPFSAALRGERLRPIDVDACPELPPAPRLAQRLRTARFATLSGASGTGKSITAFHAARRLNREGWKVVELTQAGVASHADVEVLEQMRGPVLAVVDDAQALDTAVLSALQSVVDDTHAVLLVATDRLEARNDETLLARQSQQVLHEYCLANVDVVGPLLSQLDDRVRWSAFDERPDRRLELAARTTNEPWLYMFVASGGERRIAAALDRAVDDVDAAFVLAAVCIGQMTSRDAGVTRQDLADTLPDRFRNTTPSGLFDSALSTLIDDRLVSEQDGRLRAVHLRVGQRALADLGLRDTDGVGAEVRRLVRAAILSDAVDPIGKLWLLRVFDRFDEYKHGPGAPIVDAEVAHALLRQTIEAPPGLHRGAMLYLLSIARWFRPLTSEAAEQLAINIVTWFPVVRSDEVHGYRSIMGELRSYHRVQFERIEQSVKPDVIAARLSSAGSRRSAQDWAHLLRMFSPDDTSANWDSWAAAFAAAIDPMAMQAWLTERDEDSHPSEIYELIDVLAGIAPRAALAAFEACATEIGDAMARDLADAGSNFAHWTFGFMAVVASLADAPTAPMVEGGDRTDVPGDHEAASWHHLESPQPGLRDLAAAVLAAFERIDWNAAARSLQGKRRFELEGVGMVLEWLSYLSTDITDRIADALPPGWLKSLALQGGDRGDGHGLSYLVGDLLYPLSAGPRGAAVVRELLVADDVPIGTLASVLVGRFPDIAVRFLQAGLRVEAADPLGAGWEEITDQLSAVARIDRGVAAAWLEEHEEVLVRAMSDPQRHDLTGVAAFITAADTVASGVLDDVVAQIDPDATAASWVARWADARDAVRPMFDRILVVPSPAADLVADIVHERGSTT